MSENNIDTTAKETLHEEADKMQSDLISERKKEAEALAADMMRKIESETPHFVSTDEVKFAPPKAATAQADGPAKKKTKTVIVNDIMKLQEELRLDNPRPRSHYERMNKKELEENLAFLTNKGVQKLQEIKHVVDDVQDADEAPGVKKVDMSKKEAERGAKALFQLNMIVVKVAELTSVNFKENIGTDLKGLSEDCLDNRDQLEEILAQIYEEYKDEISSYISPFNQYALLMLSLSTQRAIANRTRVEDELKKGV